MIIFALQTSVSATLVVVLNGNEKHRAKCESSTLDCPLFMRGSERCLVDRDESSGAKPLDAAKHADTGAM